MPFIGDYNKIMSDRNIFNQVVYTPLSDALKLLDQRKEDVDLSNKVKKLFKGDLPEILTKHKCGVIARQIATPNFENRLFVSLCVENGLKPVFFEFLDDKFTSNNKYKHSLGQLNIKHRSNKEGQDCVEKITIVDFNKYDGEKLGDVQTLWGEELRTFHQRLFDLYNIKEIYFHDESSWYSKNKIKEVQLAYFNFFLMFISNGILFENFPISPGEEGNFTREVVLPMLDKVIEETGVKPLIVPIPPMDLEDEDFWYHHLPAVKNLLLKR